MPELQDERFRRMRVLDEQYQKYCQQSMASDPRGGYPIGGGDWMDNFFKAESIRGMLGALRSGATYSAAIKDGIAVGEIAITIWNGRREWQVRRWNGWIESFLLEILRRSLSS